MNPPRPGPVLRRPSPLSPLASLAVRLLAVLALFAIAMSVHWFDRDGLKDNIDGHVSFTDVIYFTAITVTTVGYGDIVPVSDQARMFDTFVVTPIRIFVWLIFLGTAYTYVLKHGLDRLRMRLIQQNLRDHIILCGFGETGREIAAELCRRGSRTQALVVVDPGADAVDAADGMGLATIQADATRNATLEAACVNRASAVLIACGRDDTAVLITLTARKLAPNVRISTRITLAENEDLARDAGADVVVNPVSFGSHLLAASTGGPEVSDYAADLLTMGGDVILRERPVTAREVGQPLNSIATGQPLRILRGERRIGFWEAEAARLEAGDRLIEVVPSAVRQEPA